MRRRFLWFLANLEEACCALLLITIVISVLAGILSRYLGNWVVLLGETQIEGLLAWLTLFGAAIAYKRNAHLAVSALADFLPGRVRRFLTQAEVTLALLLYFLMAIAGIVYIVQDHALKPTAKLPLSYLALPIGGISLAVRSVQSAWRRSHAPPMS